MAKKKQGLLHSQISGTIWFAAVLIIILALVFFFFPKHSTSPQQAPNEKKNIAVLQKKEDSAYRSRRLQYHSQNHRQYPSQDNCSYPAQNRPQSSYLALDTLNSYYSTERHTPIRQPLSVELNSADTTTLQLLHGIGPTYARRIVKYRERLGGFISTDQLLEVYGFTPELLDHIRPHLCLDPCELRKININTMTLKQLIKHPYMDYYFARDLVNLRSRGATFSSPDDLRTLPSCNDTLLSRLLPYLEF